MAGWLGCKAVGNLIVVMNIFFYCICGEAILFSIAPASLSYQAPCAAPWAISVALFYLSLYRGLAWMSRIICFFIYGEFGWGWICIMASGPRKWEEMDGWKYGGVGNYLHITKEYIPRIWNTILIFFFFKNTTFIKKRS